MTDLDAAWNHEATKLWGTDHLDKGSTNTPRHQGFAAGYAAASVEVTDLKALFDLQYTRMAEATALWRLAHPGNDDIAPDLGALITWLMGRARIVVCSCALQSDDPYYYAHDQWCTARIAMVGIPD